MKLTDQQKAIFDLVSKKYETKWKCFSHIIFWCSALKKYDDSLSNFKGRDYFIFSVHLVISRQRRNTSAGYNSTKPKWRKSNLVSVLAIEKNTVTSRYQLFFQNRIGMLKYCGFGRGHCSLEDWLKCFAFILFVVEERYQLI